MNWNEMQRYDGAVTAQAVYRAPILGFAALAALGMLPSDLGIASLSGAQLPDLGTFRTVEELATHQADVQARITELDNEFAGKAFSDDARAEWAALKERNKTTGDLITELKARKAEVERLAADPDRTEHAGIALSAPNVNVAKGPDDIFDLSAYRQMSRGDDDYARLLADGVKRVIDTVKPAHPDADPAAARAHLTELYEQGDETGAFGRYLVALQSPRYARAFGKSIKSEPLTSEEQRALADGTSAFKMLALTTGTPADGGYPVPVALDPTLIPTSDGVINPLREISRVETITSNKWAGVTATAVSIGYDGESQPTTDGGPTLGQPTLEPVRLTGLIKFSREIEGDWSRLQTEMGREFQDAKDAIEADKFAHGGGKGGGPMGKDEPAGVIASLPNSSKIGTVGGSGTFAAGDVYRVKNQTPPRWRSKGVYLAEDAIYDEVRQFDTDGGASMWVQLADGRPPTLAGKPARELSTMDNEIVDGQEILLYGDFSQFLIVDRVGMSVEVIPHLFDGDGNPTGERGLYLYGRNTSGVLVAKAFRLLVVGSVGSGS